MEIEKAILQDSGQTPLRQDYEGQAKLYEVAYLINSTLTLEEAQNLHQTFKNVIQDLGGLIENDGEVMRKHLSYEIKKMHEAYLAYFRFTIQPEKIGELNTKLNSPQVLRHLILQAKRVPPRPVRIRSIKTKPEEIKKVPAQPAPSANIEEIDKKLEEILGK